MTTKKFEDILLLAGDKGKWQYRTFLVLWIEGIIIGFHHLSSVFLGYTPKFTCQTNHIDFPQSWSPEQIKNYSIPLIEDDYESCKMYDVASTNINQDFGRAMRERATTTVDCTDGYAYNQEMGQTIVMEWNLVCDRLALLSTVQGSYMGGVFVGCIFWGWASDKFGRRPSILVACLVQIVSCLAAAASVNYIMFIFFRFFVAFSVSGVFECGFVLVTEIVSPEYRTAFGIMTQFPFGIGASLLPLVAYFIRDWVPLQLAISIPSLLLISYYWLIPESPRWLISENRIKEALDILKDAAEVNGNTLPADEELLPILESMATEESKELQAAQKTPKEKVVEVFREIITLFKTPEMRKRTLNIFFSWCVVAMVYYGLSFNTKNIGGDIYVSNFISGFAEVVACVVIIPALNRFGRVKVYSGTFIAGGLACISVAIILWATKAGSLVWLIITLAMTGKFLVAGTFALAYLYTAELFPTPVRNVAVGGASTFARVGSISAPYIVDILGKQSAGIPSFIFGVSATLAGLFAMLLPETLNRKLPETVADVEEYGRNKKQKKTDKANGKDTELGETKEQEQMLESTN